MKETRIVRSLAYDGHFLKVQRDAMELLDGKPASREYIQHPGAVVMLFLARKLDDGEFLDVFLASLTKVLIWVREGKVIDCKTVIGTFLHKKIVTRNNKNNILREWDTLRSSPPILPRSEMRIERRKI